MDEKRSLLALAKIFQRPDYAEEFTRGLLYMNTLDHFREQEDANVLRGDPHEGLAGIFQPSKLGEIMYRDIEISTDSLAGPLLIHDDAALSWNVFCMYALHTRGWPSTASAKTLGELKKTMLMDHQCHGFGTHVVVVTNARVFQERLKAALQQTPFHAVASLVDYYDADTPHGALDHDKAPFMKRSEYAYQREWRLVVKRVPASRDAYLLRIGDISDITVLTTVEGFNERLKLRLPDGSEV